MSKTHETVPYNGETLERFEVPGSHGGIELDAIRPLPELDAIRLRPELQ